MAEDHRCDRPRPMRYAACPAAIHAPLGKARSFAGTYAANSLADVKKVTLVKKRVDGQVTNT